MGNGKFCSSRRRCSSSSSSSSPCARPLSLYHVRAACPVSCSVGAAARTCSLLLGRGGGNGSAASAIGRRRPPLKAAPVPRARHWSAPRGRRAARPPPTGVRPVGRASGVTTARTNGCWRRRRQRRRRRASVLDDVDEMSVLAQVVIVSDVDNARP